MGFCWTELSTIPNPNTLDLPSRTELPTTNLIICIIRQRYRNHNSIIIHKRILYYSEQFPVQSHTNELHKRVPL